MLQIPPYQSDKNMLIYIYFIVVPVQSGSRFCDVAESTTFIQSLSYSDSSQSGSVTTSSVSRPI